MGAHLYDQFCRHVHLLFRQPRRPFRGLKITASTSRACTDGGACIRCTTNESPFLALTLGQPVQGDEVTSRSSPTQCEGGSDRKNSSRPGERSGGTTSGWSLSSLRICRSGHKLLGIAWSPQQLTVSTFRLSAFCP
jgi:hypothetical protein